MMPAMRRNRHLVIAVAVAVLASTGGQALAVDGGARPQPAASGIRLSPAGVAAAESAAMSAAMLAARSPRQADRALLAAQLPAVDHGGAPTLGELEGLSPQCLVDESGGSGSASTGPAPDAAAAAVSAHTELTALLPAGDLNRNDGPDVLDYRLGVSHGVIDAGVTARSARTGAALWSRVMLGTKYSLSIPFPDVDRVGPANRPGVLLVDQSEPFTETGTTLDTLTVRALSGSGAPLWTTKLTGQLRVQGDTETLTNFPVVIGDIHDVARRGHDLLVDVINVTGKLDGSENGSDQAEIISARTGVVEARGPVARSRVAAPEVVPVPSLNRDRLDDLAVIDPGTNGRIVTERGDTGARIWASSGVPVGGDGQITSVGHLGGSAAPDLVVSNDAEFGGAHSTVSLINGVNGRLMWTVPAQCGFRLGKAGPKRVPAVGLIDRTGERGDSKSETVRAAFSARERNGDVVYHRAMAATIKVATSPSGFSSSSFAILIQPIRDVQPDGSNDLVVGLTAKSGHHMARVHGVLSGRDGRLIHEPAGVATAGSLQRGSGVDLVTFEPRGSGLELSAYDGATGNRFYARRLVGSTGLKRQLAYGVRVSGHSCSDLVVSATNKTRALVGLLDANSQPLWTVTASRTELRGGHRHVGKRPVHFCLA